MSDPEYKIHEDFLDRIDDICYLQPELYYEIMNRLSDDLFFWATCRNGEELLLAVLERRQAKGISTNIYIHGGGSTQVGKSIAGVIIAIVEDPDFSLDQLMFDFAELDRKLPKTQHGKRYILDDVRNRLVGSGAVAETQRVVDFMETNAEAGISLTVVSPGYHELAAIHYRIEMLGFCDEFSLGILYNRKGTPIAWMCFVIEEEVDALIPEYRRMKREFREQIKAKGAGAGYTSGKVQQLHQDILDKDLTFKDKRHLKRFITLNYDHWTQRIQDACFDELKEIFFGEEQPSTTKEIVGEGFVLEFLEELPITDEFLEAVYTYLRRRFPKEKIEWLSRYIDGEKYRSIVGTRLGSMSRFIEKVQEEELGYAGEYAFHRQAPEYVWGGRNTDKPDFVNHENRVVISFKTKLHPGMERLDRLGKNELALFHEGYTLFLYAAHLRNKKIATYKARSVPPHQPPGTPLPSSPRQEATPPPRITSRPSRPTDPGTNAAQPQHQEGRGVP